MPAAAARMAVTSWLGWSILEQEAGGPGPEGGVHVVVVVKGGQDHDPGGRCGLARGVMGARPRSRRHRASGCRAGPRSGEELVQPARAPVRRREASLDHVEVGLGAPGSAARPVRTSSSSVGEQHADHQTTAWPRGRVTSHDERTYADGARPRGGRRRGRPVRGCRSGPRPVPGPGRPRRCQSLATRISMASASVGQVEVRRWLPAPRA